MESPRRVSSVTRLRKRLILFPSLALVLLWGILYLPNLRTSPTWYGDETGTLLIGRDLVKGESAIQSLYLTHWHTYYPIQPVYAWVVGLCSTLTGGDIWGGRFFNTLLGLAITLSIFLLGRRKFGFLPAFWGAALFLTYSQSIIHFRWIYPHNAVALGFAFTVLFLMRRSNPGNDWKAGLGLGIAALSHPLFVHGAIASVLCRLKRPRAWVRLAVPPTIALGAVFLFITWRYWPKPWLLDDLIQLAAYYGGRSKEASGESMILTNLVSFFTQDSFHLGAAICLLVCLSRRYYILTIFAAVISVLLLQNRANLTTFYYQAIVLTPLFAMAWAGGLSRAGSFLRRKFPRRRIDRLCYAVALVIPLLFAITQLPAVLAGKLVPRNQPLTTQNTGEVEAAAAWLNEHTTANDLVIANTNIAWLLHAKTADLMQSTLWAGLPTEYLAEGMPHERFRYSADLNSAKYVVLGDIDQRWMLMQLNVAKVAYQLEQNQWPVVFDGPNYVVLENPHYTTREPSSATP